VASTQGGVTLSSFSGNLDSSRIIGLPSGGTADWNTLANKPAWVASTQGGVTLSSFSGNLDSSRINGLPSGGTTDWNTLANKPAWVASTQGGVTLSSFSGNLDSSRITNLPSGGTADWNTLANKPAWVASTQGGVALSSFSGNLDVSRINNMPTGGAATTWSTIDRPEWTNQFSYSNIGPFISPSETTNFDIITNNSITPVVDKVYNIGQRFRRYNVVHTENLNLTTAIFDNGVRQTYFSGSYNELRDKPTISGGTWTTLTEKPEWTTKFSYSNIGPLMHPTTSTNLDVVISDSMTPMLTSTYNIGQDRLRWLHIFSDNVVCNAIRFAQPGSYSSGTDFTAERLIYNENLIDLTSADCEVLKTDVAKLKTDYAALLSIVNKLSTAPVANNTTFWNSLRRERLGTYDGSSNDVYMYYIPTAYIVGDSSPTKITLSGVDYYMPRLTASSISIDPTFAFGVTPLSTSGAGYTVYSPGSTSTDPIEWRQVLLNSIKNTGFIWRRFS
jgi:hypothetical protein